MKSYKSILGQVSNALTKNGVSESDARKIESELENRIRNEPDPKIAFI